MRNLRTRRGENKGKYGEENEEKTGKNMNEKIPKKRLGRLVIGQAILGSILYNPQKEQITELEALTLFFAKKRHVTKFASI